MTMKLWMYENYIWELQGEEFIERRLSVIDPIFAVEKRMPEKKQARASFEPLASAIPVQRSASWTNKPTGSKSLQIVIIPKKLNSHFFQCDCSNLTAFAPAWKHAG